MKTQTHTEVPVGTQALILSKLYYGVLTKSLENLDIDRYYSILYFLNNNNGCSQQFICNHLAIDKTAMVKVIDYLIKANCIIREVNPIDRREHVVILTKKGQKHTEEIVKSFNAIDETLFSGISKSDRAAFTKVMTVVTGNLKELPGDVISFNCTKANKKQNKIKPLPVPELSLSAQKRSIKIKN